MGGGAISCAISSPIIKNCIISNNRTEDSSGGGGIYCDNASPIITNCVISNNIVESNGGGIMCDGTSNPTITNCTIVNNTAAKGGGIYCNYGSPVVTNTIIWNNSPEQIFMYNGEDPIVSYSDIEGWQPDTGSGNINSDPMLTSDFYLMENSPCIDAGTSFNSPLIDINGILRPQGNGYDIGAYEYY